MAATGKAGSADRTLQFPRQPRRDGIRQSNLREALALPGAAAQQPLTAQPIRPPSPARSPARSPQLCRRRNPDIAGSAARGEGAPGRPPGRDGARRVGRVVSPSIVASGSSSSSRLVGRPTTAGRTAGSPPPPSSEAMVTAACVVGLSVEATAARAREPAEGRGGEAGSSSSSGT